MKKMLALVLALVLCLSLFCGCGKKDTIVGTWKTTIDIGDYAKSALEESMEMEFTAENPLKIDFYLQFTEDSVMKAAYDEEQVAKAISTFVTNLSPELVENLYQQMEDEMGYSKEEADTAIREFSGGEYSSLQEYVDSLFSEFAYDMGIESEVFSGTYTVEEDKIKVTPDEDSISLSTDELRFTLKGDKLTFYGNALLENVNFGGIEYTETDEDEITFTRVDDKEMPAVKSGGNSDETESDTKRDDPDPTAPQVTGKDINPDAIVKVPFEIKPNNEPCVLIDNEYMTVSLKSVERDVDEEDYWWDDMIVKFEVTNKTEDAQLILDADIIEIDGVQIDDYFFTDVNAGNTAVQEFKIDNTELVGMGFGGYNDLTLYFTAELLHSDSRQETQLREEFDLDPVTVKINLASSPSAPQTIDTLSENGIEIGYIGSAVDFADNYVEYYLCKNTTDKDISIESENCVINGYEIDTFVWMDVLAGKSAILALEFSDLDDSGLKAEEVHGKLTVDFIATTYVDWFADQIAVLHYPA